MGADLNPPAVATGTKAILVMGMTLSAPQLPVLVVALLLLWLLQAEAAGSEMLRGERNCTSIIALPVMGLRGQELVAMPPTWSRWGAPLETTQIFGI